MQGMPVQGGVGIRSVLVELQCFSSNVLALPVHHITITSPNDDCQETIILAAHCCTYSTPTHKRSARKSCTTSSSLISRPVHRFRLQATKNWAGPRNEGITALYSPVRSH